MIMNENLNLVEILKNCPKGTKLYSTVFGEVKFESIHNSSCLIKYKTITGRSFDVTYEGKMFAGYDGECTLFPSREERDWSKFKPRKNRFDPKTLRPYNRVIARDEENATWRATLFSHYNKDDRVSYPFVTIGDIFSVCIPYNEDTKHLVGTTDEAPEYYRYWEK